MTGVTRHPFPTVLCRCFGRPSQGPFHRGGGGEATIQQHGITQGEGDAKHEKIHWPGWSQQLCGTASRRLQLQPAAVPGDTVNLVQHEVGTKSQSHSHRHQSTHGSGIIEIGQKGNLGGNHQGGQAVEHSAMHAGELQNSRRHVPNGHIQDDRQQQGRLARAPPMLQTLHHHDGAHCGQQPKHLPNRPPGIGVQIGQHP